MERAMHSQSPSEWHPQPSTSEPTSPRFRSVSKNGIRAMKSSTEVREDIVAAKESEPPKPPPSPPTSPPLAIPDATFSPFFNGSTISDAFITNAFGLGSSGYPATLPAREWFHRLVQKLPLYAFTASNPSRKVIYSRKRDISSKHAERIRINNGVKIVGFDLEWKPMRDRGKEYNRVSLVQIATEDEILLVQLPVTETSKFPLGVQTLLEDPSILKVGAGIQNDVDKLKRDWKVKVTNYLDLAFLARYHDYFWDTCDVLNNHCIEGAFGGAWCEGSGTDSPSLEVSESSSKTSTMSGSEVPVESNTTIPPMHVPLEQIHGRPVYPETYPVALARLVSRYLGKRLDKECQLSNWAAPLNEDQIEYAANDGCSSLDVYNTLIRLRDCTPGWVDAQAMFYRMVIEYHQNLAVPVSPYQAMAYSPPDLSQLSLNSSSFTAPGIEETMFTMEGDEFGTSTADISARSSPAVFLPLSRHPQSTKPSLQRSLSDTGILKVAPAAEDAPSKPVKTPAGSHPLYPSPPVTPTHTSVQPAPSPSASKSVPASPISTPESPLQESAKQSETSSVIGSNHSSSTSRGRARALKWKSREIYSVSHPNPISNGNKHGVKSERTMSLPYNSVQNGAVEAAASYHSYYGEHSSLNSGRASQPNNAVASTNSSMPSSKGYFPPTPATPYANHNAYDASMYYPVPAPSYAQVMPSHGYPYAAALPYHHRQYAYGPYYYSQAQAQQQQAHAHSQPTYYWMSPTAPAGNQDHWSGRHSYSSQTAPPPPAAALKKRPSLRYSDGVWCPIDSPTSASTSAVGDVSHNAAGANGWVKPVPHGIPTPQFEADVTVEKVRGGSIDAGADANGWVAASYGGEAAEAEQEGVAPREEGPIPPRRIFVGDVALGAGHYSDNVRFNSTPAGVSFGPGDEPSTRIYA